jgi:uncharacterized protein YndB with AHSA1/START domain
MLSVARSITIDAPPARVFDAYTRLESWSRWVPHFRELTLLSDGPLRAGFRARIRTAYTPLGGIWEVTELQPGRSFAWTYRELPGLRLTVDHIAEPSGVRTRATLALRVSGPLGLLIAPVTGVMTRRTFDRSLAALKARLEGGPSSF